MLFVHLFLKSYKEVGPVACFIWPPKTNAGIRKNSICFSLLKHTLLQNRFSLWIYTSYCSSESEIYWSLDTDTCKGKLILIRFFRAMLEKALSAFIFFFFISTNIDTSVGVDKYLTILYQRYEFLFFVTFGKIWKFISTLH